MPMDKTIFALFGKGGSGKSTTIAYVLSELKKHASNTRVERGRKRQQGRPAEVWRAILTINGVLVGIASPGDNGWFVRKHVQPLIDADCQVIVCATRSTKRSTSVQTLRQLAAEADPPYKIMWIRKVSDPLDAENCNRRQCGEIVSKLLEAVGVSLEVVGVGLWEA
jgi:ABC-type dipeptide/oligopeptide/nickel transport system ATPase subunit